MLLEELYDTNQLDEGVLQRVVSAAALVLGAMIPSTTHHAQPDPVVQLGQQQITDTDAYVARVASLAAQKYKVPQEIVEQVAKAAIKYQYSDFPRARDLLAVVTIESSFNPSAKSKLKTDPALGVMQVRPGAVGITKAELASIDGQMKHGARILRQYYERFGTKEAALHAYNVGPTNHLRSVKKPAKGNPRYVPKFNRAHDWLGAAEHPTR